MNPARLWTTKKSERERPGLSGELILLRLPDPETVLWFEALPPGRVLCRPVVRGRREVVLVCSPYLVAARCTPRIEPGGRQRTGGSVARVCLALPGGARGEGDLARHAGAGRRGPHRRGPT